MNESTLLKLKAIVERAVRPVKASFLCKKNMREELFAHVTAAFEEEMQRSDDEAAALIQVEKRFGDPTELARKLQESVPTRFRTAYHFEQLIAPRTGESLIRRAARHGIMSSIAEACAFIALSPLFSFFWNPQEIGMFVSEAILISIGFGVLMFASTLLINQFEQALFSGAGPSSAKTGILFIVSFLVPIALYFGMTFVASLLISDDMKTVDLAGSWRILLASVVFTIIIIWIANRSFAERSHIEEWAKLQVD